MDEKTIVIGLTNEPEPLVDPEGTMVPDERTVMPSGNYDKELAGKGHAPVDEDYERTTALHAAESPEHRVVDTRSESEQPSDANPVFVIRGNVYQTTKLLSSNSGEAEIYLVSQGGTSYVLKIYFSKSPQMEMLRIVSNMHFEMIVNILDYGTLTWNGKERFYELMEYLEGGPLSEYKLNGDEQSFRRIALSAAAALAYCHTSLVMHKDIKPANFFFRDKDHKQLVLGDFGISSVFQEGEEKVRTTQARTPVYAAPEMYSEVIDGVVEITPAADYYSLGITLLYVWLGRTPFTKNERVMMRMKNEGRLPGIDKAPEGVSRVIRGLTCLDSGKRWTYDEVERWYKGEDVPVEEKSFFVRYKSFVVNPEKNVVANDVKELAPLLNDYRELGIRYLYGKHIRQWLEECGNTALAMIMDDIVEHRYPTEPQSGLSAAIYAMDENFPYIGHDSEVCHSMPEVCLHVLKYADVYAERLKNPYDLLLVYVEARKKADRHQLSRYFLEYRKEVAIARFVYEIDETMPFLAHLPSDTPEQIVASFGTGECTEDQWRSLVDGRLLSWLSSHQLHTKYEPIRSLTEDKPYAKSLAYFVLYTLDGKCAFDLKSAFTPLDVAELMDQQLQRNQHTDPVLFEQELDDFIGEHGCLHFYATTRGWFTVLSNHKQILNLTSQENTERLGVYDRRIAAYRLCAALGATPSYAFETEGKTVVVKTLEELEQLDSRLVRTEMRQGALKSWLTLFFHEAPHATFEADLSYEKALRDYLMLVGKYDPSDHYYKRFMDARTGTQQVIDTTKQTLKQVIRLEMILRNSMIGTAVLLLFLLVCYGITKVDVFVNYIWFGFWIPLCLGSMLVGGIKGYFSANGVTVILLGVLGGLLTSLLPVYALKLLYRISPSLVTIGSVALIALYVLIGLKWARWASTKRLTGLKSAFSQDSDTQLVEPLVYSFKSKTLKYNSSKMGVMDDIAMEVSSARGELMTHYWGWIIFFLLFIVVFVLYHPALMDRWLPNTDNWIDQMHYWMEQIKDVR